MTKVFRGRELAERLHEKSRRRIAEGGRAPRCAVLWDAGDPGMAAYARRQRDEAAGIGIALDFLAYAGEAEGVLAQLRDLGRDGRYDGVMTLYPLPRGVEPLAAALLIGPDKDVDGLHPLNAGRLALGAAARAPATARACLLAARALAGPLKGLEVTLVGASRIVGRPLAALLLDAEATVTVCHAATRDLAAATRGADVVVSAAGVPGLIGADHIGAGAVLLDVAVVRTPEGLAGDVDLGSVTGKAAAVTHVPDGIGPITTACLFETIVSAAFGEPAEE